MLNGLARLLLVSTSLAPILLIYAAAIVEERSVLATGLAVASVLLVLLCWLLLFYVTRVPGTESIEITSVSGKDTEIVSFLVAYMLPVLLGKQLESNLWALIVFVAVLGLVLFKANVHHVNPLMGMLGYHFYEVEASSKIKYLMITRRRTPFRPGTFLVKYLSPTLLLEVPTDG